MNEFKQMLKAQDGTPDFNEGANWAFKQIRKNIELLEPDIPEHYCEMYEFKLGVLRCNAQCEECLTTEKLGDLF